MAERYQLSEELLEACERGELGTVQNLISRGADPSYTCRRWWSVTTALHAAARYVCAPLMHALQLVKPVLYSGIR